MNPVFAAIEHWEFWDIFASKWFWCGLGGWIVASLIKMVIAAFKTHEFDFVYLVSTGGMPSSHSATVAGIAFGIGGIAAAALGLFADHYGIVFVYNICAFLPALGLL